MRQLRRQCTITVIKILDQTSFLLALFLAVAAVYQNVEGGSFPGFLSMRLKVGNFLIILLLMAIWDLLLSLHHLYSLRRFTPWLREALDVVLASTWLTAIFVFLSYLGAVSFLTPLFVVLFWGLLTTATLTIRFAWRFLAREQRRRGLRFTQALMLGTNSRAVAFAASLESSLDLGYRVIGFVDEEWFGLKKFLATSGYPLVANLKNLPQYLREHVVDEVIIDLPLNTYYRQVLEIVRTCLEQGIVVRFVSDSFYLLRQLGLAHSTFEEFNNTTVISVFNGWLGGLPLLAKRLLDILGALILLSLLSPLFILIAIFIKKTSPGPVFFVQERLGLNKRLFRMYKFRSMVVDAPQQQKALEARNEAAGPVFKIKNDPRVTPLGALLRRTSLDELPQLFNVLQGDMSLVGPRPLPVRDYSGFSEDWHRRRFSVKPGLTCLWQIQGRSALSFEEWMQLDLQYIDYWSFWLDIKILLATIPAVLREKGAY